MGPNAQTVEVMKEKGYDIWFCPTPNDVIFLNSKNVKDEQKRKLKDEFNIEVFENSKGIYFYYSDDYEPNSPYLVNKSKLIIKSYPWIFRKNVSIDSKLVHFSNKLKFLDLSDWCGDIRASNAFVSASAESIVLGKSAKLTGEYNRTFARCNAASIEILSEFCPEGIMSGTFYSCSKLSNLELKNPNFTKVTGMFDTFAHCNKLQAIDLGTLPKLYELKDVFYKCASIDVHFCDRAIMEGTLQDWCNMYYGHNMVTKLYVGQSLIIFRTNYPEAIMRKLADKQGLTLSIVGEFALMYLPDLLTLEDRREIVKYLSKEEIDEIFPGFCYTGLEDVFLLGETKVLSSF